MFAKLNILPEILLSFAIVLSLIYTVSSSLWGSVPNFFVFSFFGRTLGRIGNSLLTIIPEVYQARGTDYIRLFRSVLSFILVCSCFGLLVICVFDDISSTYFIKLFTTYSELKVSGWILLLKICLLFFVRLYAELLYKCSSSANTFNKAYSFEVFLLNLFLVLLFCLLHGLQDFVTLFLVSEAITIVFVGLIALTFTRKSAEASLRYIFVNFFASVLTLLGMAVLYLFTGTLNFNVLHGGVYRSIFDFAGSIESNLFLSIVFFLL